MCASPEACAVSITAVAPPKASFRIAQAAPTGARIGPTTAFSRSSYPAATAASRVPSPPSATGNWMASASG